MIEQRPEGEVLEIDVGIEVPTSEAVNKALDVSFKLYDKYYSSSSGCGFGTRDIQFIVRKDEIDEAFKQIREVVQDAGLTVEYLEFQTED